MLELSNKILEFWQVRKTKEQKTAFIEFLKKELNEEIIIEQGGLFKSRNLIVGDINKAEFILAAHYDTQPVLPFPNFLTPKNILIYIIYSLFQVFIFFIIMFISSFLTMFITQSKELTFIMSYVVLGLMMFLMLFGKANKHTANDNTSGVITLIEAMHHPEIREKAAFVFFDHEELGLLGSSLFAKMHRKEIKNKLLINFDCVSDGDTIMFVLSKQAQKQIKEKAENSFKSNNNKTSLITSSSTTFYPSDQMNFKNHIGVAAFKKNKLLGYYIDRIHTSKDTIFDERNIELIIDNLLRFVQ